MEIKSLEKVIKIDQMVLESGLPILSKELSLIFNQPRLIELAILGEENLFDAIATINFDKEALKSIEEIDEETIENSTDFLWMFVILKNNSNKLNNLILLLQILFKDYEIILIPDNMEFKFKNLKNEKNIVKITELNFNIFKQYFNRIFYVDRKSKNTYNPKNKHAEKIAKKLEEGRKKIESAKKTKQSFILCNTISALAEASSLPLQTVYDKYTMVQFYTQLLRHQKHEEYNQMISAMMAGAGSDIKLENWYGDL